MCLWFRVWPLYHWGQRSFVMPWVSMCLDDGSLVVLNGWTPPTTGGRRAKEGGWRGRFVFSFSRLVFFCDISGEYPGDSPEMEYQSCREVDIWWYLILTYYILYIYCTWWYDVIEPFGLPLELIWFCADRSEGINRSHTLWQFHIIISTGSFSRAHS